jgi:hypothetical protein
MQKLIVSMAALFGVSAAFAQNLPSPVFNNVTVNGAITAPEFPNLSANVEGTGVPGLDGAQWFIWNNNSVFSTGQPTFRVSRGAPTGVGISGTTEKAIWGTTSNNPADKAYEWTITGEQHNVANASTGAQNVAVAAYIFKDIPTNTVATTGASGTGSVATVTFLGGATIPVGYSVLIAGVTPNGYNGVHKVTASAAGSVSFASPATGAQTVAGTIVNTSVTGSWGLNSSCLDNTAEPDPIAGCLGAEIDVAATSATTDANRNRVGLQIAPGGPAGSHIGRGLLMGVNGSAVVDRAAEFDGSYGIGLDFTGATFSNAPVMLAGGQKIVFDGNTSGAYNRSLWLSSSGLTYTTQNGNVFFVGDSGQISAGVIQGSTFQTSGGVGNFSTLGSGAGASILNFGTGNYTYLFPQATTTLVGADATQTLTNKTISSASNTITLTNATGLPVSSGISGLGAGVATALAAAPNSPGGFLTAQSPSVYLGQVATRCFLPNNAPTTGVTWVMSRSAHWMRENVTQLKLVFPNFSYGNPITTERTSGAGTIKASIEYPAGTFTLSNENISASGPVAFPNGNTVLTFNVTIPNGAQFWVRSLQNTPTGAFWHQYQSAYASDPSEGMNFGTGTATDYTTSGSISPNVIVYGPALILANTTHPALAIFGDSREEAGPEGVSDITSDIGLTARSVGGSMGYAMFGVSGSLQSQWLSATRTYRDQLILGTVSGISSGVPYFSHASNEYGVNDISGGASAATLASNRASMAALYPKIMFIGETLEPYNQSTDGWLTTTNQALGTNEPKILVFNDLVRAGIVGEKAVWDVADAVDPMRVGQWTVSRNPYATTYPSPATFTGSITGNVLTVTAISSGSLTTYASITDSLTGLNALQPSTYITGQLSGATGSTGTYSLSRTYGGGGQANVASKTLYVGAFATMDGLHQTQFMSELIKARKAINLDFVRR